MNTEDKTIFFHVGISKTGSTFLQNRVFPLIKKLHYIPTNRYRKIFSDLKNLKNKRVLVSRELDRQFEAEIIRFSNQYKNVTPIIVLRRHEEYFASQYKRFVKNGFKGEAHDFMCLKEDNGFFRKIHFNFLHQIDFLKKHFNKAPIVLFHHDLKSDPLNFIKTFCFLTSAEVDLDSINFSKKHSSYSEKQLKTIKAFSKWVNLEKRRVFKNPILHLFWRLFHASLRYGILYFSILLPNFIYSKEPLIDPSYLKKIKHYFKDDWEACLTYQNEKK